MKPSADPDAAAWLLRLAALNETARRKHRLLAAFGSAAAVFTADDASWARHGLDPGLRDRVREAGRREVGLELAKLTDLGAEMVARGEPEYPVLLASLPDPPAVLFVRGRLPESPLPCVALVGTRRASPYGELVAEDLGRGLAAAGVGVISGLAAGIDAAAHRGALAAGGYTAGVLGTGIDVVYPPQNRALHDQVAATGAVLSEFCLGVTARDWHFPMRNRIISGLCRAVVVVQAPARSGALITAHLAAEQGREVLAVPGNVTDSRQTGCHDLIREGAALARGVEDVLEVLRLAPAGAQPAPEPVAAPEPDLSPAERTIAGAVGLAPVAIDDLLEQSGLSAPEVQSALVTLELKRVVRRLPGNRFVRVA